MLFMSLIATALAASTAGMGLSPLGGGFGGINDAGVLGLAATPAAARSPEKELALDLALSTWTMEATLDGEAPIQASGIGPLPYLGFAMPIGKFGVGVLGSVPYGGGGTFPAGGAQRFHLQEGEAFLTEGSLALAFQPFSFVRVGVSGRFAQGTLKKRYAVDAAGLLNTQMAGMAEPPEGEEILEGSQELDLQGFGLGYAAGISTFLRNGVEVHASYRSPVAVDLSGTATVTPSSDLDLRLRGDASTTMVYPREIALGVVVPTRGVRLMMDVGWAGWGTMKHVNGTLDNISIESDDESLSALMSATGMDESSLTDTQKIYNDLGNVDVFYGGAGIDLPLHARWTLRTGAWWAPTSILDETFHIGVADYSALDLRAGLSWMPSQSLTIAASIDTFVIPDRTITTSQLALTNEATSGRVLPSANGTYSMKANRYGLTVIYRL